MSRRVTTKIEFSLTLVYGNANLQIVNRKKNNIHREIARWMKKKSVHTILHPIERWCECTMPKNSKSMKYLWHMIITRNLEHTRDKTLARVSRWNSISISLFPCRMQFLPFLKTREQFLGSRKFWVLLLNWQVLESMSSFCFFLDQFGPKTDREKT